MLRWLIVIAALLLIVGSGVYVASDDVQLTVDTFVDDYVKPLFERRLTATPALPAELVSIPNEYRDKSGSARTMTGDALSAYLLMVADARLTLPAPLLSIVSAYRSNEEQARLYASAVERYGSEKAARKWVAPPGKSNHVTGRTIDLQLGLPNSSENVEKQRSLPAYQWLAANAASYGFYPYLAEPWHWEYNPA